PLAQRLADIRCTFTVVSGNDRRHTLHQVWQIALSVLIRQISESMRVRVYETGRDDHSRCVNDSFRREMLLSGIANEDYAIAANADIDYSWFAARTIHYLAMNNENVELIDGEGRCQRAADEPG